MRRVKAELKTESVLPEAVLRLSHPVECSLFLWVNKMDYLNQKDLELLPLDELYHLEKRSREDLVDVGDEIDGAYLIPGNFDKEYLFKQKSLRRALKSFQIDVRMVIGRKKGIKKKSKSEQHVFQQVVSMSVPKHVYKSWMEKARQVSSGNIGIEDVEITQPGEMHLLQECERLKAELATEKKRDLGRVKQAEAKAQAEIAKVEIEKLKMERAAEKEKLRMERAEIFDFNFNCMAQEMLPPDSYGRLIEATKERVRTTGATDHLIDPPPGVG